MELNLAPKPESVQEVLFMDLNNFTKNSLKAISAAQSTAVDHSNQQVDQAHLLYALLTQEDSLIKQLMIRMGVDDISVIGRNTSGVKLMSIEADSDVRVASIAKVRESSRQDEEDENVADPESMENEDGETTEE